jgi:hypothetical protein
MSAGEQIATAIVGREGVIWACIAGLGPNSFYTQATVQTPGMAGGSKTVAFRKCSTRAHI